MGPSEKKLLANLQEKIKRYTVSKSTDILDQITKTVESYSAFADLTPRVLDMLLRHLINLPGYQPQKSCCGKNFTLLQVLNKDALPAELESMHYSLGGNLAFATAFNELVKAAGFEEKNGWKAEYERERFAAKASASSAIGEPKVSTRETTARYKALARKEKRSQSERLDEIRRDGAEALEHDAAVGEYISTVVSGIEKEHFEHTEQRQKRLNLQAVFNAGAEASIERIQSTGSDMRRVASSGSTGYQVNPLVDAGVVEPVSSSRAGKSATVFENTRSSPKEEDPSSILMHEI